MRDGVLDDKGLDAVRMSERHSKANRAAIVLHIQRVARKLQLFGKAIDDVGVVIETYKRLMLSDRANRYGQIPDSQALTR